MQATHDITPQPLLFHTLHGQHVTVRPATTDDTLRIVELLNRLSAHSFYLRYLRATRFSVGQAWREATRMVHGHPPDQTTLLAMLRLDGYDDVVAVGELARDRHNPTVGEIALIVRDDMQRQRIGSFLLWRLIRVAQRDGYASMSATIQAENHPMHRMLGSLGLPITASTHHGETQVLVTLPTQVTRSRWRRASAAITLPSTM